MNKQGDSTTFDVQVDSSLYTTAQYCLPGRFAAYAYQIKEILDSGAKKVLEIGPGNGVVTYVLRKAGIHVDTLDHDPALNPDFLASVLSMPFAQNSYDAVMCCQVLEHLPWQHFRKAMEQISNIAKEIIVVSLPHVPRRYYIEFKFPKFKKMGWAIDMQPKNMPMSFNGEHYWEIGRGVEEKDVLCIFDELHLTVQKSFRVPEFLIHHFFCLSHNIR